MGEPGFMAPKVCEVSEGERLKALLYPVRKLSSLSLNFNYQFLV